MQYRSFGKHDLLISEIGLGCEHLQGKSTDTVVKVVDAAIEAGINILDCFMPEPKVRSDLGIALRDRRDKMMIQGHLRPIWSDNQYRRTTDIDETKRSFDDFLNRLDTDYIDFGMIHMVDNLSDFHKLFDGPILQYALDLKSQGVIHYIGVSSHNSSIARKAAETGLIDCMMLSINPAYDMLHPANMKIQPHNSDLSTISGIDDERMRLYQVCQERGIAITSMKTLGAGILLKSELSPFGIAMSDYQCIRYALDRPAVVSAMIGMKTVEEIERTTNYHKASPEETDYTGILRLRPNYAQRGVCVYCNHCLPCPSHLDIAQIQKYTDMVPESGIVPPTVLAHYENLAHLASECIACGKCEQRCPFSVDIRQRMKKAVSLFGK